VAELAGISRVKARALFAEGVLVDGRSVAPTDRLNDGLVEFTAPEASAPPLPAPVPYRLAYEDDDLLIVDKPAGLVVHPGAGQAEGTLAGGLLFRYPELEGVGQAGRWGIVHRLDQGTSGLLVVARTPAAYTKLQADLAARRISRTYLCLVHGVPEMPTGTIDAPIGRDPRHPTRKRVAADGRPARTHYRTVSEHQVAALLEVELETGRTHQIRVHLASIGHPVVGDRTYGRRTDPVPLRRMFLHAHRLRLTHPQTGTEIEVSSPLPADLQRILDELSRRYSSGPDTVTP
jgi:23S rRNA pseudouridine1911/1915/1917 synthase